MSLALEYAVADLVAVRGTGLFARAIRRWTNDTVSHIGMIISIDPLLVMESLARVRTAPLYDLVEGVEKMYLLHARNLSREDRRAIVIEGCRYSARSYGVGKIVLQALDLGFKTEWFSEHLGRATKPICSWFCAMAYAARGYTFGESARTVRPDEILSFAQRSPVYDVTELDFVMPGETR